MGTTSGAPLGNPWGNNDLIPVIMITGHADAGNMGDGLKDSTDLQAWINYLLEANGISAEKNTPEAADNYEKIGRTHLYTFRDEAGIPLIVWGTQDCREGHYSVTWNVDGKDLTWFTPEHCMVLVGMDDSAVRVADPIYGNIISYERSVFESCYDSLFQQAVAICPDSAAE